MVLNMSDLLNFLQQNILLVLSLLVIIGFLIYEERGGESSHVRLCPADVVHLINRQGAKILDIRQDSVFKSGHIAGAFLGGRGVLESAMCC